MYENLDLLCPTNKIKLEFYSEKKKKWRACEITKLGLLSQT